MENQILENARLDRMEQHLRLMKDGIESNSIETKKISDAFLGNEYSGGIGLIHQLKKMHEQVEHNKDEIDNLKHDMNIIKYLGSTIIFILGGWIINLLSNK